MENILDVLHSDFPNLHIINSMRSGQPISSQYAWYAVLMADNTLRIYKRDPAATKWCVTLQTADPLFFEKLTDLLTC